MWAILLLLVGIGGERGGARGFDSGLNIYAQTNTSMESAQAMELNWETFNRSLAVAPAEWAMVEFYADWCPHCRHYKPVYDRVARIFNGLNAVHPGYVYMAKVDCAASMNSRICNRFNIDHYPTLLWGKTLDFINGGKELESAENLRTDTTLLQWINQKIGKSFTLDDVAFAEGRIDENRFDSDQVAISVYDIEEATAKAMEILLGGKLLNQTSRPSFISFLQLLVIYHPSIRCRKGAGDILMNMEEVWPSLPVHDNGESSLVFPNYEALELIKICGDGIPQGYWMFCRGSINGTRGYSCGLWLLFHSLSVRAEDSLAYGMIQTICSFVRDFFKCKECMEHFTRMCMSANGKIGSRYDLVMWLWHAHNEVNKRVGKVEAAEGTGDPKFPKIIWPSRRDCDSCLQKVNNSKDLRFHEPEVYQFLLKFYGHSLNSSSKGNGLRQISESLKQTDTGKHTLPEISTSSTMTVPIVAAICIVLSSLGFGAVACYWRMQQKKRKIRHGLWASQGSHARKKYG